MGRKKYKSPPTPNTNIKTIVCYTLRAESAKDKPVNLNINQNNSKDLLCFLSLPLMNGNAHINALYYLKSAYLIN